MKIEYQVNARTFLLLILSLLVTGCQSDMAQQTGSETIATSTALQPLPAQTADETETAAPAATRTSLPAATVTQEPPSVEPTITPAPYPSATALAGVQEAFPEPQEGPGTETLWSYRVVNEYPHDAGAFTQGLVVEDGPTTLLEGTGRDSSLRRVDLHSGQVQETVTLPDEFFGEGITLFGDRIYQLTWQSGTGFVYDRYTFEQLARFFYPHQGWGLTHDGSHLIVSDGSDVIRFWDPETIQEVRQIQVTSVDGPVTQLNELEYVDGEIWANIWHTDMIARISPEDGRVLGWIDLTGLMNPQLLTDSEAVLNGIAYDEASDRLFVTGKLWPSLFEIEVFAAEGQ